MDKQQDSNSYKPYCCEFKFDEKRWDIDIHARSREEAEEKLKAVSSGKVLGELACEIPANCPIWLYKIISWFKSII